MPSTSNSKEVQICPWLKTPVSWYVDFSQFSSVLAGSEQNLFLCFLQDPSLVQKGAGIYPLPARQNKVQNYKPQDHAAGISSFKQLKKKLKSRF